MTRYPCPSCGADLSEVRRFCPECGAPLAAAQGAAEPPRRSGRMVWAAVGAAGCLGLLMLSACAGLLLLTLNNVDPPAPPVAVTALLPVPSAPASAPVDTPARPGELLLSDDFDQPAASDLEVAEDAAARYAFEDGGYVIEVYAPETVVWTLVPGDYRDVVIACETVVPAGAGVAAAGILFHYQDERNFYLFRVASDGYYALDLLEDDEWVALIDWTHSAAIDASDNALRVEARGDRIVLSVNGQRLEETRDGTFRAGEVGLATSSFDDERAAIRFDNLVIRRND